MEEKSFESKPISPKTAAAKDRADRRPLLRLRLASLMEKEGLSEEDVANAADVKKDRITGYLRGYDVPSRSTARKIADIFGVTDAWLFGETDVRSSDEPVPAAKDSLSADAPEQVDEEKETMLAKAAALCILKGSSDISELAAACARDGEWDTLRYISVHHGFFDIICGATAKRNEALMQTEDADPSEEEESGDDGEEEFEALPSNFPDLNAPYNWNPFRQE